MIRSGISVMCCSVDVIGNCSDCTWDYTLYNQLFGVDDDR